MKRPCKEDLVEASEFLSAATSAMYSETDVLKRVATWLVNYAQDSEDRAEARRTGCSVKYLRKIRKSR